MNILLATFFCCYWIHKRDSKQSIEEMLIYCVVFFRSYRRNVDSIEAKMLLSIWWIACEWADFGWFCVRVLLFADWKQAIFFSLFVLLVFLFIIIMIINLLFGWFCSFDFHPFFPVFCSFVSKRCCFFFASAYLWSGVNLIRRNNKKVTPSTPCR